VDSGCGWSTVNKQPYQGVEPRELLNDVTDVVEGEVEVEVVAGGARGHVLDDKALRGRGGLWDGWERGEMGRGEVCACVHVCARVRVYVRDGGVGRVSLN
jgi:hypothetical protein